MEEKKYKEVKGREFWNPENSGEELVGTVKAVEHSEDYGKICQIEKADGETIFTPSHKVLQSRLKDIDAGAEVKIIYEGEQPPSVKGNNPTKMYRVFVA